jgi:predicted Zn-dependent protease
VLDKSWDDAILAVSSAARRKSVFVEVRADLTAEAASGEDTVVRQTVWAGTGVESSDGTVTYHSDLEPEHLPGLVAGHPPERGPRRDPQNLSLDPAMAVGAVTGTVVEAQRRYPKAQFNAVWVESDQSVKVSAMEGVVDERRIMRRIRLDGVLQRSGRTSRATSERVVGTDIPVSELIEETVERLEARLGAVEPIQGPATVVFAPSIAGILIHELVGHAAEADRVERGASWLSPNLDPFPRSLTVIDDPRRARAAWKFDDEGTPARPVALILDGRPKELLHTLGTAAKSGQEPTGHARRGSFRERLLPRMGCTFVANGHDEPVEILKKVQQGIYVRRMESANIDPSTGRALFRITDADAIVNGTIAAALQPHLLETLAPQALAAIDGIGNDLAFDRCIGSCHRDGQPLSTSVGAPTICTRLMTVRF